MLNIKFRAGQNIVDIAIKKAIPKMNKYVSQRKSVVLKRQFINIVEYVAKNENIEFNKIYNLDEFIKLLKDKIKNKDVKNDADKAIYYFIKNI